MTTNETSGALIEAINKAGGVDADVLAALADHVRAIRIETLEEESNLMRRNHISQAGAAWIQGAADRLKTNHERKQS